MTTEIINRRKFLALISAAGLAGLAPGISLAREQMPKRRIPGTNEYLPIIGLGSTKPVGQIADRGTAPIASVLRTLVENGGSVVDTWPRNQPNDEGFGRVINEPDLRDALFVTSKIDRTGKQAGIDQFRQTQRLYQRNTLDLLQVFNLTDVETQWSTLMDLKAAGEARYIGVTVSSQGLYDQLATFVRREQPDFVQVNYSITERGAEQRMLPMLQDKGIGVIINRPFMNGDYFRKIGDRPLPEWAAEFDCESWAQFSLKYILPHPAITCVLTETTKPKHMAENARAAFGRMPDQAQRARMRDVISSV
ncbi:MAG: aldo/keto reductase [Betaproteobacteria bacterium]|nr:MAG: aldo/keto reductase [Betaproteobacteria bacterium]